MTKDSLLINEIEYKLKETFDVNITLDYENDTWSEWHIIREFISNALDSVAGDISKIDIKPVDDHIHITDNGEGYPVVYAKRIGATSKKGDTSTIGTFGEGSKLALLTCLRKNINVYIGSQNWLIVPSIKEEYGQSVLIYKIYETLTPIKGSIISIMATDEISHIINNLSDYFLQYDQKQPLFGSINEGIYPLSNGTAKLYNKGVFVRNIDALYSYAISIEKINRDRDLISHWDLFNKIRRVWENVSDTSLIRTFLEATQLSCDKRNQLIEFYSEMYSNNPTMWADAFVELYGDNTCLYSDDYAQHEAERLDYKVIKIDTSSIAIILNNGGIQFDFSKLSDDYQFTFVDDLSYKEQQTLQQIQRLATITGYETISRIKVFEQYANHENVCGLYNSSTAEIYLKRNILDDINTALQVYLHELNHHNTGADDLSREFASGLCKHLTDMTIKYSADLGDATSLKITAKGLELPPYFELNANELTTQIAAIHNNLIIEIGRYQIHTKLNSIIEKAAVYKRIVSVHNNRFIITIPTAIKELISGNILDVQIR